MASYQLPYQDISKGRYVWLSELNYPQLDWLDTYTYMRVFNSFMVQSRYFWGSLLMNPNIFDRSHVASIFIPATRGNRVNTSISILIHVFSFLPGDKLPPRCSSVPLTAFVLRTFTCQHQHLMKRHEIVICWFHTGQLNTASLPLQTVSHAHSSLPLARIICTWEPICACTCSHCGGMSVADLREHVP